MENFDQQLINLIASEVETREKETQSQAIIKNVLSAGTNFFHTPEGKCYAEIKNNTHLENWPITSKNFKNYLRRLFYEKYQKPPNNQALQDALGVLEAKALFDAPEKEVFLRVAGDNEHILIDMGDENWSVIEVTATGYEVKNLTHSPFRRGSGILPLPFPQEGNIELLKYFVNVEEKDFILLVSWLLQCFNPVGSYPILVLQGEQGTAKSTTSKVLRDLIDPCTAPLRSVPREERDVWVATIHNWILAFDNLSGIPCWLSDVLCRVSTGAGSAGRTLYTDEDETTIVARRPIIVNGIDDITSRNDFLDRSIILYLPPIPEEKRKPEAEFWKEFEIAKPKILGALLNAVSAGLRNNIKLNRIPRMADFALWSCACCEVLPWNAEEFLDVYEGNRKGTIEQAIEFDAFSCAVRNFTVERKEWTGTAQELLDILSPTVSEAVKRSKAWPSSPRGVSGRLRRSATFLRQVGVEVEFSREATVNRRRLIRLSMKTTVQTVQSVQNASTTGFLDWTVENKNEPTVQEPSNKKVASKAILDDMDDMDGRIHSKSKGENPDLWPTCLECKRKVPEVNNSGLCGDCEIAETPKKEVEI